MSGKAVGWAFERHELTSTQKFVLVALADNASSDGVCWPSQRHLMDKTGLKRTAMQDALRRLEELGLLAKHPRMSVQGRGRSSDLYQLALDQGPVDGQRSEAGPKPASRTTKARLAGDQGPPGEPCIEPPENPQEPVVVQQQEKDQGKGTSQPTLMGEPGEVIRDVPFTKEPQEIGGQRTTVHEHRIADEALAKFSEHAEARFIAKEWRAKIIRRVREHPELTPEDHREVIARNFRFPWWKGKATPAVIYGSAEQFERALVTGPTGRVARKLGKYEREHQGDYASRVGKKP